MFAACIDLVGTRERARTSQLKYIQALESFQGCLATTCIGLARDQKAKAYLFSDSAFAEASDLSVLVEFVRELRFRLMQESLYFKSAIMAGALDAASAADRLSATVDNPKKIKTVRRVLEGSCFSGVAAELFVNQELLKGIGVVVHPELEGKTTTGAKYGATHFVDSCFIPESGSRAARHFRDVRFLPEQLDRELAESVMRDCLISKTHSRKFGRFYVSLMVTWIQSLPLDTKTSQDRLVGAIVSGEFGAHFSDIAGSEMVLAALLARVIERPRGLEPGLREEIVRKISRNKRFLAALEQVPIQILGLEVRAEVVARLSDSLVVERTQREEAGAIAKELVRQGMTLPRVARELARRGYRSPLRKVWTIEETKLLLSEDEDEEQH